MVKDTTIEIDVKIKYRNTLSDQDGDFRVYLVNAHGKEVFVGFIKRSVASLGVGITKTVYAIYPGMKNMEDFKYMSFPWEEVVYDSKREAAASLIEYYINHNMGK